MIPDTTDPKPDPTPEAEPELAARQRIEELDDKLFEAEQELEAAASIIDKQDREIASLKFRLECFKILLELEEDVRRILDRQLAEARANASGATSHPRPVIAPVPKKPAAAPPPGYPPGYRPNPVVEAMIAAALATGKQ